MKTLNEALRDAGYSTRPGDMPGRRTIMKDGKPVLANKTTGDAWRWLRNLRRRARKDTPPR